jgi:hypothetical protein
VAVGVLQRGSDTNKAAGITVHEQQLDETCLALHDFGCRGIANCLVASDDTSVVGGIWCILVDRIEDGCLHSIDVIAVQEGGVDIGDGRVDV